MNRMSEKKKNPPETVAKPYLPGEPTDENTVKSALKFFGIMILIIFMCFLVSMMMSFDNTLIRIGINLAIVMLVYVILYTKGANPGAEAVARGEILYQRREKGQEVTRGEQRLSFHRMKGYLTGFLGTLPFLIPAVILAVTTRKTMTSIGALPDWMSTMIRRSEIGDALTTYTQTEGITGLEILRVLVRIFIMPFISMTGSGNRDLVLIVERLSPMILLLPAIAYGTGYMRGPKIRTKIHTEIEQNRQKRKRRENKARRERAAAAHKHEPEQLN